MNDKFCVAPWIHAHLDSQGMRRLCCIAQPAPEAVQGLSYQEFKNSDYMKDVRRKMLAGEKLKECHLCDVPNRVHAYRDLMNQRFANEIPNLLANSSPNGEMQSQPVYIDYRSHSCNLKCKTCGPGASSSWLSHMKANREAWGKVGQDSCLDNISVSVSKSPYQTEAFDLLTTPSVKSLYFAGGEPLLAQDHLQILDRLIESGQASGMTLSYNTNLTLPLKMIERWAERILKFQNVIIFASVDGTREINDYIRTGANFQRFEENLDFILRLRPLHPDLRVSLDPTLTSLLMLDLISFSRFAIEKKTNIVTKMMIHGDYSAAFLRCEFLSQEVRHQIRTEWLNFHDSLSPQDQNLLSELKAALELASNVKEFGPDQIQKAKSQAKIHQFALKESISFEDLLARGLQRLKADHQKDLTSQIETPL